MEKITKVTKDSVKQADKIAKVWKNLVAPIRPSKDDIKIYQKFVNKIKNKKKIKALILGSTPELRDLALKDQFEVIFVDLSKEIANTMKKLMKQKGKERFIRANWLNIPLEDSQIDICMGDDVFTMVDWNQWEKLLQEIKRLLIPEGHLLTKVFIYPKKNIIKTPDKLYQDYKKGKITIGDYTELLGLNFYDKKTRRVNMKFAFKIERGLWKEKKFTDQEFKKINSKTKIGNRDFFLTYPNKNEWEKLLKKYFEILDEDYPKDYWFGKISPIYFARARK